MTAPLLEVRDLKAYYRTLRGPVRAVDGVNMAVQPGEIFGIAGESGSGKSTLAKAMLRLHKPPAYIAGGSVLFDGFDIVNLNEEALRRLRGSAFAYIPQSSMNALNPVMRVRDQIIDTIGRPRASGGERGTRARRRAAGDGGAAAARGRHVPARAERRHEAAQRHRHLDRPRAAADRGRRADDGAGRGDAAGHRPGALAEIRDRLETSVVLISHDLAVHAEVVDRLLVMYAGKVVEIGSVFDLFEDPCTPIARCWWRRSRRSRSAARSRGWRGSRRTC